jgi:hypothetical protein
MSSAEVAEVEVVGAVGAVVVVVIILAILSVGVYFIVSDDTNTASETIKLEIDEDDTLTSTTVTGPPEILVSGIKIIKSESDHINIAELSMYDNEGVDVVVDSNITASSIFRSQLPSYLNDGNVGTFFATGKEGPQWMEVLLKNPVKFKDLKSIKITNRRDCCKDRASGMSVQLLDLDKNPITEFEWILVGSNNVYEKQL